MTTCFDSYEKKRTISINSPNISFFTGPKTKNDDYLNKEAGERAGEKEVEDQADQARRAKWFLL
ncbi:hypothetical protein NY406_03620 [Chlorobaculum sp. MV4-Y]|uniref:hypothetical protein n=1 Tax=Chlorobaculum sp. MV4-Y TaxID=2976335 RepID=UPI0021AEFA91|nr:hypothetical protein [Chlorobaculum sp. MV4-Y]UWX58367.1 hypothetical protein NY406_03620 [Chlorobaculum sp. MV4-Y]